MYFLASDQSDFLTKLFSSKKNVKGICTTPDEWLFPTDDKFSKIKPTDAKRVDINGQISILVATHGAIAEVPYQNNRPVTMAHTYKSCHSVERLPDGNLISTSSKHNRISIHYNPKSIRGIRYLNKRVDYLLPFAHGAVFDKKRNLLWTISTTLRKWEYDVANIYGHPSLTLMGSYDLPKKSGHDLFPSYEDRLLLTVNSGIYEFDILTEKFSQLSKLKKVKSAVRSIETGEIFITKPNFVLGYAPWQTHTIQNLSTGEEFKKLKAKFYKVRLWEPNTFSY